MFITRIRMLMNLSGYSGEISNRLTFSEFLMIMDRSVMKNSSIHQVGWLTRGHYHPSVYEASLLAKQAARGALSISSTAGVPRRKSSSAVGFAERLEIRSSDKPSIGIDDTSARETSGGSSRQASCLGC